MEFEPGDKVRICAFGEILWDIIDGSAHLGGAPFNFAAHATRMGLNTTLISRVGDDRLGEQAVGQALLMGVDTSCIGRDRQYSTGTVNVSISAFGQPSYEIGYPAAWDFIQFPQHGGRDPLRESMDAIYFGTLAQRHEVSRCALRAVLSAFPGSPIIYDVNLRQDYYTREIVEWGLRQATIVKMNGDEAGILSRLLLQRELTEEDSAQALHDEFGIDIVLVTLGSEGCLVVDDERVSHLPGHCVDVVDTVGAGDAFAAAFLASWLKGGSLLEAAALANLIGSNVASKCGAVPEYSRDIVARLSEDFSLIN